VITQPIHPSQKVIEKNDFRRHFIVELKVIPTYELTMLIMGWRSVVEVLQPISLRQKFWNCINGQSKNFQEVVKNNSESFPHIKASRLLRRYLSSKFPS
jgi:hypothetical protein